MARFDIARNSHRALFFSQSRHNEICFFRVFSEVLISVLDSLILEPCHFRFIHCFALQTLLFLWKHENLVNWIPIVDIRFGIEQTFQKSLVHQFDIRFRWYHRIQMIITNTQTRKSIQYTAVKVQSKYNNWLKI